jgi:hypothetical protein
MSWAKYAGTVVACKVDGYLGKFDAELTFPTDPSEHTGHIVWRGENKNRYAMPVRVPLAIGRCEDAEARGEKPHFYYS